MGGWGDGGDWAPWDRVGKNVSDDQTDLPYLTTSQGPKQALF